VLETCARRSHTNPVSQLAEDAFSSSLPWLRVEYWSVERLKPYERNPRKNDKAVDQIRASIREFGFAVPILAKSDGEVIDSHLRLKGAIAEGMREVPVVPCDGWTDAQVKAVKGGEKLDHFTGGSGRGLKDLRGRLERRPATRFAGSV
jgi:hypothetical protein